MEWKTRLVTVLRALRVGLGLNKVSAGVSFSMLLSVVSRSGRSSLKD